MYEHQAAVLFLLIMIIVAQKYWYFQNIEIYLVQDNNIPYFLPHLEFSTPI